MQKLKIKLKTKLKIKLKIKNDNNNEKISKIKLNDINLINNMLKSYCELTRPFHQIPWCTTH